jgi:hypothetical protein
MAQSVMPRYVFGMVILRRMAIGLLSVALSIGPGWQSCATSYEGPWVQGGASANHAELHGGPEDHLHSMTDQGPLGEHPSTSEAKGQPDTGHGCLKCCGVCMLTSVISVGPGSTPGRTVTHVIFASLIEQSRGRIVLVDPDIPKPVV